MLRIFRHHRGVVVAVTSGRQFLRSAHHVLAGSRAYGFSVFEPANWEPAAGPVRSNVGQPAVTVGRSVQEGRMNIPPGIVVDNMENGAIEPDSEFEGRLPSEINLEGGNIDTPEPVMPKT